VYDHGVNSGLRLSRWNFFLFPSFEFGTASFAATGSVKMDEPPTRPLVIVILSGATGRTASHVVNSALAQFESPNVRIVRRVDVRSPQVAVDIVREVSAFHAVICHSLVTPKVRDALLEEARRHMIPTVDILGPMLAVLSDHLGTVPRGKPGLAYASRKEYFDRMDAVSYTLEHDDGTGLATLDKADVVLVGVSRVSKSVTCFYLGYRGIRAANVPLIPGFDPPAELLEVSPSKVIGLTVNPHRLHSVRQARRSAMGTAALDQYADPREVGRELSGAQEQMNAHGWRCIDVSYMAVEEVARSVMRMIGR